MRTVLAEPLDAQAFSPFGEVFGPPAQPGRAYFDGPLGDDRPAARPSLSVVHTLPAALPLRVTHLERHPFSSQSFVAMDGARWLVIVCPHAAGGGPDTAAVRAFIAAPGQGVTYRRDTWHHSLTVLERPAAHAILMWCDGTSGDEEILAVEPFNIVVPSLPTLSS